MCQGRPRKVWVVVCVIGVYCCWATSIQLIKSA